MSSSEIVQRAIQSARVGRRSEARELLLQVVETDPQNETAWMWLSGLVDSLEDRIIACENVLTINPANERARAYLSELQHYRQNALAGKDNDDAKVLLPQANHRKADPLARAKELEQLGKFEDALNAYKELAGKARDSREFDHIYKQILRIEGLRKENIRYVSPSTSIQRLTFVWPLLYFSLVLVQVGLNPIAHPAFYLWLGLPVVILGSFLLSLAEVRTHHVIWQKLFSEQGEGSSFARLTAAATGWFLVLLPHVLIVLDSLNRLQHFKIPLKPF